MVGRHTQLDSGKPLSDEVLDEIEGEALVIIEHAGLYGALTVAAASRTLATVRRLRRPCKVIPLLLSA